ncbi:MAG: DNRLRE domain-containing protein [Kofleriaceae bacterium]
MRGPFVLLLVAAGCGRVGFGEGVVDGSSPSEGSSPDGASVVYVGKRTDANLSTMQDTYLDSDRPLENFGAHLDLHAVPFTDSPVLFQFDLSSLSPLAASEASLSLWVVGIGPRAGTRLRFAPVLESWTEGTGDFTLGVANHQQRSVGNTWSTAGADQPLSRGAALFDVPATPDAMGRVIVQFSGAIVETWAAADNGGIAMIADNPMGEYIEFGSSEFSDETKRPLLRVMLR